MKRTLLKLSLSFAVGWVLGWASVLAIGAWYAYRELDQ